MKYFWIFLFICGVAFAENPYVDENGVNLKYSYKDFMGKSFKHLDPLEFSDSIVRGSGFYQENKPNSDIFPDGIINVIFEKNNLDNVYIPPGNTIEGGCHRLIRVQNDMSDWKLNEDLTPKEPLNKEYYLELGLSIDPKDLPDEKMEISIVKQKEKELEEATP